MFGTSVRHTINYIGSEILLKRAAPSSPLGVPWARSLIDVPWATQHAATGRTPRLRKPPRKAARSPSTVGAIRVQHPDTGIYVGTVTVDMAGEMSGTEFTATCVGAATIIVDESGEEGLGDTTCLLSIMGYDLETSYEFELEFDEGDVTGDATADLDWFEFDFDLDGSLDNERITATWEEDVYGFIEIAGDMDVERITQDISSTE